MGCNTAGPSCFSAARALALEFGWRAPAGAPASSGRSYVYIPNPCSTPTRIDCQERSHARNVASEINRAYDLGAILKINRQMGVSKNQGLKTSNLWKQPVGNPRLGLSSDPSIYPYVYMYTHLSICLNVYIYMYIHTYTLGPKLSRQYLHSKRGRV